MIKKEKYLFTIFAFILWGGWAYLMNIEDINRFRSSFFQGIASFTITIFMVELIIILSRIFKNSSIYVVATLTVFVTSSIVFTGHIFIETKDIFYTILPTIIVAFTFSIYIATKYKKLKQKRKSDGEE